ncbi:MAG: type II toxin-antitoxin system VapC family toxin [Holosporales bacterium]
MSANMTPLVIDSSALLAFINDEPGGEQVAPLLGTVHISAVNAAEVVDVLRRNNVPAATARDIVLNFARTILPFEAEDAWAVAALREKTAKHGLSLADRACLALAQRLKCPVVTADRVWATINVGVKVKLIR